MAKQGFFWVRGDDVPDRISDIPGTVGETFTIGEALTIVGGSLTKATNGAAIAGFSNQSKTCTSSDTSLEFIEAGSDDVFRAPYTGTPDAAFKVGANTVDVSADGLSILSSDVTGGAFAIRKINTNNNTVHVSVKNRIFS